MSHNDRRVKRDAELNQDPRRLRRRRLMARMTLRAASGKSGVSYGHLSDLENGRKSAGVAVLGALADAYGCDVEDLMPPEENGKAA